ncbi:major capsid proten [Vibrio phage YC]|uniref:Major capsid proten n=1 Tax=Vibrio phage YC TaxID=2267403 RepID=A0A384ZSB8_9CAUD|nr:major capsid proten [Vibrio phage YC]AXC34515.1 major capsid proten [Vibrio phage YC]
MQQLVTEQMRETWKPVVEKEAEPVRGLSKTDISIRLLENQSQWGKHNLVSEESAAPGSVNAHVGKWQPILVAMAKRLAPVNIAMEFFGVQPLSGPDGQIFALRARKGLHDGTPANGQESAPELFMGEADSGFSGDGTAVAGDPSGFTLQEVTGDAGDDNTTSTSGAKKTTPQMEVLGSAGNPWNKVGVTIQKASVTAEGRGLYADYSHELRQDMMNVHGEDVDSILADVLVTEIQAEMNREFIRLMNVSAKLASQHGTNGVVDINSDASGRWAQEKWKYMLFMLAVEAQMIGIETRRGKGNKVLCSPNVASALSMAGMLDNSPALVSQNSLEVDVTGQTYAGKLANGMDIYIDPYAGVIEYITIAYKGVNQLDAGAYYAPYIPLEMFRATGEDTMQPRMAFKTRYGVAANPFVQIPVGQNPNTQVTTNGLGSRSNPYFRKMAIKNLF